MEFSWHVLDVKAKLVDLVQPVGEESIDVQLRTDPCDGLLVSAENEARANVVSPRRLTAQQVVAENAKGIDHCKRLQVMGWISLLDSQSA